MAWYDTQPVSKITDLLFVGNYGDAVSLIDENIYGVQAVLNVSTEVPYQHHQDIQYVHIPFKDGYEVPEHLFAECMGFLKFQHDLGRRTLVHCAAGISRSPCVVAAFMHWSKQLDLDRAIMHVKVCRPIVQPHPLIVRSIKRHLKVWPYTGEYDDLKLVKCTKQEFLDLLKQHPDANCAVRQAYGSTLKVQEGDSMHKIITCTCKKA